MTTRMMARICRSPLKPIGMSKWRSNALQVVAALLTAAKQAKQTISIELMEKIHQKTRDGTGPRGGAS